MFFSTPTPEPVTETGFTDLMYYLADLMENTLVCTFAGYTFSLMDVFKVSIVLAILGWVLGKLINPWGHEHD